MDTAQLNGHKRAVIYARVSTDEQARSGTSLDKQEEACRKYAESSGFQIVGLPFRDDYTGAVPIEQRPEGSKAFAMLTSGEADALIVFAIDRLVRPKMDGDEWDIPILIRGLAKSGKEIHTTRGEIEASFVGLLTAVIGGKAAGDERRTILERMMDGKHRKARAAWVGTGFAPFGYTKIGKEKDTYLEINHYEAQIVRRIFDLYLGRNGESKIGMDAMAALFNDECLPVTGRMRSEKKKAKADQRWHSSAIRQIMVNRAYIGEFAWGGEVVTIPTLAIIDRETFEAAQAQRERNKIESPRNVRYDYLLRGRMVCTCGRKIAAIQLKNNGKTYLYYQCNRKFFDPSPDCDHKNIRAELADRVAWNWLVDVFKHPEKLLAGLREYQARQHNKAEPNRRRLAELPGLIADCAQQAKGLTVSLAAKNPDDPNQALAIKVLEDSLAQVSAAHKRYTSEREKIEAELAAIEVNESDIQQILGWAAEIRTAIDADAISFEAKRGVLDRLNVTTQIEYQDGERGLRLACPVLSVSKWRALKPDCVQPLAKDCIQIAPQYSISGWVSLADAFFGEAVKVS